MKKGLIFATFLLVTAGLFGQNTFKYEVRVPSLRVGGATKVKVDSVTVSGDTIKFFTGATELLPKGYRTAAQVGAQIHDTIAGGVALSSVAVMIADTANMLAPYALLSEVVSGGLTAAQVGGQIHDSLRVAKNEDSTIGPLFVFGTGSGHIADTALFNNGRIAGAFYNSGQDTLYVTEVRGVLVEGTGTETITCDVMWDVNRGSSSATHLVATGLTVTSMTTGTVLTSFSNNMILPGRWVWCTLSGASANNKPTMLILQLTGYKRNRSN